MSTAQIAITWSPSMTPTGLVDGDQPVAVAVEGEAGERAVSTTARGKPGRVGGAALAVDVACRRAWR